MSIKLAVASAVVFAGTLLFAGRASAQWSSPATVAAVEPSPDGQSKGGVSVSHCDTSIVVGFGVRPTGGEGSMAGYAVSLDAGKTFQGHGVLPLSSQNNGFGLDQLGGGGNPNMPNTQGPSLGCTSGNQNHVFKFYYATTATSANDPQDCGAPVCSAISVSTSTNNGNTWGLPVFVVRGTIDNHDLNSPVLAVDNNTLYLAYVETNSAPLGSDFTFPDCQGNRTTEIRLTVSQDAGATWAAPLVIDRATPSGKVLW